MSITREDYPQPFRFTSQNARENAAKSWAARRQRKAKLEAEAAKGRQSTPQSERLALQIERVERMMETCNDPDDLQKFSAAYSRLFKAWQVLTETPNPGNRKPNRRPTPRYLNIEPINPVSDYIPSAIEPKPVMKEPVVQEAPAKTNAIASTGVTATAPPPAPESRPPAPPPPPPGMECMGADWYKSIIR